MHFVVCTIVTVVIFNHWSDAYPTFRLLNEQKKTKFHGHKQIFEDLVKYGMKNVCFCIEFYESTAAAACY